MRAIFAVSLALVSLNGVLGSCGTCGSRSGSVCRDRTSFSFCKNDHLVDSEVFSCAPGTYCGNDYRICSPDPEEACNPTCGNCTSRFACLSENTYALCFGQGYPSGNIYTCPYGRKCSTQKARSSLEFCFDESQINTSDIDCYKNIVVKIKDTDGGMVLLPPLASAGHT